MAITTSVENAISSAQTPQPRAPTIADNLGLVITLASGTNVSSGPTSLRSESRPSTASDRAEPAPAITSSGAAIGVRVFGDPLAAGIELLLQSHEPPPIVDLRIEVNVHPLHVARQPDGPPGCAARDDPLPGVSTRRGSGVEPLGRLVAADVRGWLRPTAVRALGVREIAFAIPAGRALVSALDEGVARTLGGSACPSARPTGVSGTGDAPVLAVDELAQHLSLRVLQALQVGAAPAALVRPKPLQRLFMPIRDAAGEVLHEIRLAGRQSDQRCRARRVNPRGRRLAAATLRTFRAVPTRQTARRGW